ncbi:ABC transporter permease [Crocinitomix sp.]|nr:ABC transporter permease [Crocinitomix sp.]
MTENTKIVIYSAQRKNKQGVLNGLKLMFTDAKLSHGLAKRIAKRDISAMYRQSILGLLWAFIIPLINALIWMYLQSSGMITLSDTGIPYPVYVFSGTMLWQIFVESLQSPIQQVAAAKGILAKLNFPREAIILAGIYKNLFNALIKIIILLPIVLYFGAEPTWTIVFFPLGILSLILVGTTIGLILSPIGTLYTDIGKVIPFMAQFLMFFAPVVFVIPESGLTRLVFELNIMTPLLITSRDFLIGGQLDWLFYFGMVNLVCIFVFIIGWAIYRITMPVLIERMSS